MNIRITITAVLICALNIINFGTIAHAQETIVQTQAISFPVWAHSAGNPHADIFNPPRVLEFNRFDPNYGELIQVDVSIDVDINHEYHLQETLGLPANPLISQSVSAAVNVGKASIFKALALVGQYAANIPPYGQESIFITDANSYQSSVIDQQSLNEFIGNPSESKFELIISAMSSFVLALNHITFQTLSRDINFTATVTMHYNPLPEQPKGSKNSNGSTANRSAQTAASR